MPQAQQIIPFYKQPHVHTVINDNSFYNEDVGTPDSAADKPYTTLCITGANKGIDNTLIKLKSINDKNTYFGTSNFLKYGQSSLMADMLLKTRQLNVWFMRVLPDDARYANVVICALFRMGDILDAQNQPTGKKRMEIKYETVYVAPDSVPDGATSEQDIQDYMETLETTTIDPITGYQRVPLFFVRAIGRGNYGNGYSIRIDRDSDFEYDYNIKTYGFAVIENSTTTIVRDYYVGSLVMSDQLNYSTIIDDVIDNKDLGTTSIKTKLYEGGVASLFRFYNHIVTYNEQLLIDNGATEEDLEELSIAKGLRLDTFDPIFGLLLNTRVNEQIPYYRNYTVKSSGAYVTPDKTVQTVRPVSLTDWATAFVGAKCLVLADPRNSNLRWAYKVTNISSDGNLEYNEGVEESPDDDQYDGISLSKNVGNPLSGGHDGEFEELTTDGSSREPTAAEMKILLSREFVKAFQGKKDRKILSPSRVKLDFMFDANYNITNVPANIGSDDVTRYVYDNSTILRDEDLRKLVIMAGGRTVINADDINVKKAMYNLNTFRNRNGNQLTKDTGAGCHLYLDCGLTGLKSVDVNNELSNIIDVMSDFELRHTSIDFGFNQIYDSVSGRKISVTPTLFFAEYLIPHIIKYGPNKPFVMKYAQLSSMTNYIKDSFRPEIDLIDWDVKEKLYESRINYYEVMNEGTVVQRMTQNTAQKDASALLEESNVRVLNIFKKGLEAACRGTLYEWNDPLVRKGYTDTQREIYKPWIGTWVEDLDVYFDANEYEERQMMMHCYGSIKFKNIAKRIILEIDINPTVSSES